MIKITFPDNSVKEYAEGTTAMQIAESISSRLAQEVLAASVNGEIWDLTRPINQDAAIKLFKWEDEEGKHAFWHSSAHLMAEALQELYPGIKRANYSELFPSDEEAADRWFKCKLYFITLDEKSGNALKQKSFPGGQQLEFLYQQVFCINILRAVLNGFLVFL